MALSELSPILTSPLSIGALGLAFGAGLAYASKRFSVETDERVVKIIEVLPGANCGGCGFPGCQGFAEALVKGSASPTSCSPGGEKLAQKVAEVLGIKVESRERVIARVHCGGGCDKVHNRFEYVGLPDCNAATLLQGGFKECSFGCLGLGSCVRACPFDAMYMDNKGLPVVIAEKCTGCGKCVKACPKNLISLVPISKKVHVLCKSHDKGAVVRKICSVGCIGCSLCNKVCPVGKEKDEKAIIIRDFLAEINYDLCISCGLCASKCPTGSILDEVLRGKAYIHPEKCIGCTICAKACPVEAITGEKKQPHLVDADKCIGCEICVAKCPPKVKAISIVSGEKVEKAA